MVRDNKGIHKMLVENRIEKSLKKNGRIKSTNDINLYDTKYIHFCFKKIRGLHSHIIHQNRKNIADKQNHSRLNIKLSNRAHKRTPSHPLEMAQYYIHHHRNIDPYNSNLPLKKSSKSVFQKTSEKVL